jgi:hypothetical protein
MKRQWCPPFSREQSGNAEKSNTKNIHQQQQSNTKPRIASRDVNMKKVRKVNQGKQTKKKAQQNTSNKTRDRKGHAKQPTKSNDFIRENKGIIATYRMLLSAQRVPPPFRYPSVDRTAFAFKWNRHQHPCVPRRGLVLEFV